MKKAKEMEDTYIYFIEWEADIALDVDETEIFYKIWPRCSCVVNHEKDS